MKNKQPLSHFLAKMTAQRARPLCPSGISPSYGESPLAQGSLSRLFVLSSKDNLIIRQTTDRRGRRSLRCVARFLQSRRGRRQKDVPLAPSYDDPFFRREFEGFPEANEMSFGGSERAPALRCGVRFHCNQRLPCAKGGAERMRGGGIV